MAKELLERKEVDERYTWDLTAIFKTEEEYESTVEEVQSETEKIVAEFQKKTKAI